MFEIRRKPGFFCVTVAALTRKVFSFWLVTGFTIIHPNMIENIIVPIVGVAMTGSAGTQIVFRRWLMTIITFRVPSMIKHICVPIFYFNMAYLTGGIGIVFFGFAIFMTRQTFSDMLVRVRFRFPGLYIFMANLALIWVNSVEVLSTGLSNGRILDMARAAFIDAFMIETDGHPTFLVMALITGAFEVVWIDTRWFRIPETGKTNQSCLFTLIGDGKICMAGNTIGRRIRIFS
jgi:hypothetical protein